MTLMLGSRVRHKYSKEFTGTIISFPHQGYAWVHKDGDPKEHEHGYRIDHLEEIVEQGSIKKDDNKYDPSMLTPEMVEAVSLVRGFGAKKYARDNFKITGFKFTRSIAAVLRHCFAILKGEWLDPESGLPHAAHAICGLEHLIYDSVHHPNNNDIQGLKLDK
jgi:hypothetical protein